VSDQISCRVSDKVAQITFARPEKRNAAGSGGCFSAGAELSAIRDADGNEVAGYRALAEAGLAALACDVRIATAGAVFASPAIRYGLVLAEPGVARLVEECAADPLAVALQYLGDVVAADPVAVSATRAAIWQARRRPGSWEEGPAWSSKL
jgi:enoyl-CoA hydratase/carnithine racemase